MRANKIFIKPAPGLLVRDPVTARPLRPAGETKPKSSYWLRRLRDGDAIECTREKKQPAPPAKLKTKSKGVK